MFKRAIKLIFSEEYKKKTYTVIFFMIIIFLIHPFFSLVVAFGYFGYIDFKLHNKFMKGFALKNNYKFLPYLNIKKMPARLFNIGNSRFASNGIIGEYKEFPIQIFNYTYAIGGGKNKQTFNFTVCEIEIEKTIFPHIFLKSDSMRRHATKDIFGQDKDVRIKLDGEIEDSFNLYCTQDYEIEVLQIFTRDLLQYLKDNGNTISIEFADNKIYLYDDKKIRKENDLKNLVAVAKKIIDNSGALLKRLHDDFESMHSAYNKK